MLALFFCYLLIIHLQYCFNSCPLEYRSIDQNHSFCSRPFQNAIEQRVTSLEREYILYMHNCERQRVHGMNMEKMYWNDELEEVALKHAQTCMFEHDKPNQRSVPRIPLSTGQNLAMGYENWTRALEGWIEEKEHYYHSYPATAVFSHYSQMIWHSSVLVGCAAAICPPFGSYNISWPFYVCNYITGLINSNYHAAFQFGIPGYPLHDCQGKVCLYNGTLNLQTCQCECSTFASGIYCEKLNCSMLPDCPYHSSVSCVAVNVPLECPQFCGLCERYEMLRNVYGDENLAPIAPIISSTTTLNEMNETISEEFELVTTTEFDTTSSFDTTIYQNISSVSSKINISSQVLFYLCIKYLFAV
ncbi:unnamed protein product [Adineta ricciae]|uniref:SCP domain-containing protein n=1 Tax=Adineta ricciae TaxID=249248 RepID=A0A815KXH8_ADIRI|nr:unnamed protein product [Adineta ricciae]